MDELTGKSGLETQQTRQQLIAEGQQRQAQRVLGKLPPAVRAFNEKKAAIDAPFQAQRQALEACFYGTPIDRDPESGVRRQGRKEDGWRHGVKHPFTFGGKAYDVLSSIEPRSGKPVYDRSKELFDRLCALIAAQNELAVIALYEAEGWRIGAIDENAPEEFAAAAAAETLQVREDLLARRASLQVTLAAAESGLELG